MTTITMSTMLPPTLLTIPLEIRRSIYKELFRSTIVRHGFGSIGSEHTSILCACRQIRDEAKEYIAPNITRHFSSTATMLDCLTAMSPENISQARYMRVKAFPFLIRDGDFFTYISYGFANVLPLFPGLQLDRLTVEDPYRPGDGFGDLGTYSDIESFLTSFSWKELHYISPSTEFISSSNDRSRERVVQPDGWNSTYEDLTVTMYVANEPDVAGMAEDPNTRSEYIGTPGHLRPGYDGSSGCTGGEREVLVAARRVSGASYVQDGSHLHKDIEELFNAMTWQEFKESDKCIDSERDPTAHL
jgi:hypothetical protein